MRDALTRVEIPVTDMERARMFYEEVMFFKMKSVPNAQTMRLFPHGEDKVGGSLVQRRGQKPSDQDLWCTCILRAKQ